MQEAEIFESFFRFENILEYLKTRRLESLQQFRNASLVSSFLAFFFPFLACVDHVGHPRNTIIILIIVIIIIKEDK